MTLLVDDLPLVQALMAVSPSSRRPMPWPSPRQGPTCSAAVIPRPCSSGPSSIARCAASRAARRHLPAQVVRLAARFVAHLRQHHALPDRHGYLGSRCARAGSPGRDRQRCGVLGPGLCIWGNLDPVGLLFQGTPEQVRHATTELLESASSAGHTRLVVSSGCTLAPETPSANLHAMLSAVREGRVQSTNGPTLPESTP